MSGWLTAAAATDNLDRPTCSSSECPTTSASDEKSEGKAAIEESEEWYSDFRHHLKENNVETHVELGAGSFASVWKCSYPSSHSGELREEGALKMFRQSKQPSNALNVFEGCLLWRLRECPNVVQFRAVWALPLGRTAILMGLEGETLKSHIARRGNEIELRNVLGFMKDLLSGLDFMHRTGILHCDVKPANALIACDGKSVKLADLSSSLTSREIPPTASSPMKRFLHVFFNQREHELCTLWYCPTELLLFPADPNIPLTAAVDMFSAGAVGFELLTGVPAFRGRDSFEVLLRVLRCSGSEQLKSRNLRRRVMAENERQHHVPLDTPSDAPLLDTTSVGSEPQPPRGSGEVQAGGSDGAHGAHGESVGESMKAAPRAKARPPPGESTSGGSVPWDRAGADFGTRNEDEDLDLILRCECSRFMVASPAWERATQDLPSWGPPATPFANDALYGGAATDSVISRAMSLARRKAGDSSHLFASMLHSAPWDRPGTAYLLRRFNECI